MRTFSKVSSDFRITLPLSIRQEVGIEKGDRLEIEVIDGTVVLTPQRLSLKKVVYLSIKEWQKEEFKSDADIGLKKVRVFNSVEELLKELG